MLWRISKECVVSENSCSKKFRKFLRKTSMWNYFFKQSLRLPVTCWECFSGEIYEIFRSAFTRNTCKWCLLQLVVTGKHFDQNIFSTKKSYSIFLIYVLIFIIIIINTLFKIGKKNLCSSAKNLQSNWHRIKCIADVQELNIWIRCIVIFLNFTFKVEAKKYV